MRDVWPFEVYPYRAAGRRQEAACKEMHLGKWSERTALPRGIP